MKKIISLALCIMLALGSMVTAAAETYDDSYARIEPFNLISAQNPDAPVTRSEGIKALMKLYTKTELTQTGDASAFADVPYTHSDAAYINYAYQIGFISGVSAAEFAPYDNMTLEQFIKVAVLVLGYKETAIEAGGYPKGYMGEAARLGILDNVSMTDTLFTVKNAVQIIDNMLDIKPLEPVYGTYNYKISAYTLYEQMLGFNELKALTGKVNAVGKAHLSGYSALEDNEIMVGNRIFKCRIDGMISYLGKNVLIRYEDKGARPNVVSIYADADNTKLTIAAEDITALSRSECAYFETDGIRTKKLRFVSGVPVIYNGRLYLPSALSIPQTGSITALDSNGDNTYDVLFIDEYRSFIANKVIAKNTTVYLKDGVSFNGKNGIWFNFDDSASEYSFCNSDGSKAGFEDLQANDILSVWASEAEDRIKVVISRDTARGKITSITDETVTIDDTEYTVYKPDRAAIMASIHLGDVATYALNHANELVGLIGEAVSSDLYAYVADFAPGQMFNAPKIKLIGPGFSEKLVETVSGSEVIKYNYTNGGFMELNFADKVVYSIDGGPKSKYEAKDLTGAMFERCAIAYTLDGEGRIKSADVNKAPSYPVANSRTYYLYDFNGKLNSFGGNPNRDAFYIGETTKVVCIPTNDNPAQADYSVDVEITDNPNSDESYVIMPVDIHTETQIAAMAVLYRDMDANDLKPFGANDKISVVGNISQACDENGDIVYKLEVLNGDTIHKLYASEDSPVASEIAGLTVGDLIKYNKKASGEIGNLKNLKSLANLGNDYGEDRVGSNEETVYGVVESVENDRLDKMDNVRVDIIEVTLPGRQRSFTLAREDGPVIYTYNRSTKMVSSAIPEEIQGRDRAGDGASKVFILIDTGEPIAVVNIIE